MSSLRQSVGEYVRSSEKLLEMNDLSEEEEQAAGGEGYVGPTFIDVS